LKFGYLDILINLEMSGHSHYATIKRQKGLKDAQKGKIFSKHGRAISIAVKTGGGPDSSSNYKLRMAIESARRDNMPKENIERAISKGASGGENLEEIVYEGFGPEGIAVMVEVTTDNRNRSAQEIKNLFERGGGNMGGPGSVAFNFDQKGLVVVEKEGNLDEQQLKLIDAGVEDVEDTDNGLEVYVAPHELSDKSKDIQEMGIKVLSSELVQKPKNFNTVSDPAKAQKALSFLEKLEESEDVQNVFTNIDIPAEVLEKVASSH
jgi:YebC/PmpR family DNA-binding regulatory protein